uniref:uncharacterized protein LOC108949341 n=1 Tax=Ciona intestinalis TaxID=7719 RepID=UPI00089DD5AF|nr:uncharacterized protein LOC108949341 [Ciona intestinalis]|eukprot:XP_018666905.1 uncharacterized protein LOC108949341 [Ciona intestinalis]
MPHCSWGTCNSDSKYGAASKNPRINMVGVRFFPIPKPKTQLEKCKIWIKACGRQNFGIENVTKNSYVCSKHFVSGEPSSKYPNPISALSNDHAQANNFLKRPCRPSPKQREAVCSKRLRLVDSSSAGSSLHIDTFNENEPKCTTSQTQTNITLQHLQPYTDSDFNSEQNIRRKFIINDILSDDKSSVYYTGKYSAELHFFYFNIMLVTF